MLWNNEIILLERLVNLEKCFFFSRTYIDEEETRVLKSVGSHAHTSFYFRPIRWFIARSCTADNFHFAYDHTDDRIVGECFRNDVLASNEVSKSAANFGRSRGFTSRLCLAEIKNISRLSWGERDKQKSNIDYMYDTRMDWCLAKMFRCGWCGQYNYRRHTVTPGLYELIFKEIFSRKFPTIYFIQKTIWTSTRACCWRKMSTNTNIICRADYWATKGIQIRNHAIDVNHKKEEIWKGIISMTLNDIDYVHWDDPNELMDCSTLYIERVTTLITMRCYRSSKNFVKPVLL